MDGWLRQDRDQIARSVIGGETLLTERSKSQHSLGNTLGEQLEGLTIDIDNPGPGEAQAASMGLRRGNILAQCRVFYLGFGSPSEGEVGIDMMQDPLDQLYRTDEGRSGEAGWLVALEDGLQFQPKDRDEPIWIPTQNIRICAALQRQPNGVFVDLDSAGDLGSGHPLFSIVKERVEVPDENHAFICSSRSAALAMVRAAAYSYQHKEGWTDVQYGYYFKRISLEKKIEVPVGTEPVADFGTLAIRSSQQVRSVQPVQPVVTPLPPQSVVSQAPPQPQPAAVQPAHGQVIQKEMIGPNGQKIIVRERHIYRQQAPQRKVTHVHKVQPPPPIPVAPPIVAPPPPPPPPPPQPQIIIIQKEAEEPPPITVVRTVEAEQPYIIQPVQQQLVDRHPCDVDFGYVPAFEGNYSSEPVFDNDPARVQLYQHDGYEYNYRPEDNYRRSAYSRNY